MKKGLLGMLVLTSLFSCNSSKMAMDSDVSDAMAGMLPKKEVSRSVYNPSATRLNDLLHTKLEVSFDYEKAYLFGKATLSLRPYFYPVSSLELDAKGFDISRLELRNKEESDAVDLSYKYDGMKLIIDLKKTFQRTDTFKIYIEYTAKPNERIIEGSAAISADKGLYFINTDGKDGEKPFQIWTQGETEANSCWFPTVDSPNERMTQELYITTENKYSTLSNGLLMFSLDNGDGTHTDFWKQDLAHAPYLTMMAVGEFAIVKDKWRSLDVDYYIEKKFESVAREIFGNTPEMLEFYSKKLGVDYPWDKYHQVVVRDYVSGAMENSSAVIFGEFMQRSHREMIDGNEESIVAHELFHHWFGDMVTCESWANLPLNESFATYGEYLWIEYKYGREEADRHLQEHLNSYLSEAMEKQVNMIRFDYEDKEDMFDAHSYAKGGRILHMLRKHVGDDAFFTALKLYLETNKFKTVEIHQLRLAFEEVTGEDLNWFFDQWFLNSGHPKLTIKSSYDEIGKNTVINISQKQDLTTTPLYKLPIHVDIYTEEGKVRKQIVLTDQEQEFKFQLLQKPYLVNVDAEKMLLCSKTEQKSLEEWIYQYKNGELFIDKMEAIDGLLKLTGDSTATKILMDALDDKNWVIRLHSLKNASKYQKQSSQLFKEKALQLANFDAKSQVRGEAIKQLSFLIKDSSMDDLYENHLGDSSYLVISEALNALAISKKKEALIYAKSLENSESSKVLTAIARVYVRYGSDSQNDFFLEGLKSLNGFNRYGFVSLYATFLSNCADETIVSAVEPFLKIAKENGVWWMRLSGIQGLAKIGNIYQEREINYKEQLKKENQVSVEAVQLEKKLKYVAQQQAMVQGILKDLKESEKDKNLLDMMEELK